MEELVSLRRLGASDAGLLAAVRTPSNEPPQPAQPIPLTDYQARELLADIARLTG